MTKTISFFVGAGIIAPAIIEDIALAFRQNGYAIDLIPLSERGEVLAERLASVNPDIIFSLDAKGLHYPEVQSSDAQRVAWFVDNPLYFSELDALKPWDHIFVWDRAYVPIVQAKGFSNVHYLPLGTNPARFHDGPIDESCKEKYACEVCFVGTLGESEAALRRERLERFPAEINSLVDKMLPVVSDMYVPERYERARDVCARVYETLDGAVHPLLDLLVDVEINARRRRELVSVVGEFSGYLFGDEALRDYETATTRYRGAALYTADVRSIYRAANITLNATRPQLRTTVNQRIFDVFACGGFLLTDFRHDLYLVAGKEDADSIMFSSADELVDKIAYFIDHPDARRTISERIRTRVLEGHTYRCRIEEMLAVLSRSDVTLGKIDLPK